MADNAGPETSAPNVGKIHVRDGVAGDVDAVIALDEQVTGIAKAGYWHSLFEGEDAPHAGRRHFLIAEEAGETDPHLAGFIIGEVRAWEFGSHPCGWVFAISVDPNARLDGIGSRLLEEISDCFKAEGVTRMRTMMARNNHLLMSFFRSHGMMAGPYIELEKDLD